MTTYSVLNTVAATAGDISFLARKLNVAITSSTGSGQFPTMNYLNITSFKVQAALLEKALTRRFSYTAADNTAYSFVIVQDDVNGVQRQYTAKVADSGVGATNATIGDALVLSLNGQGVNVTASHSGANAYVDVVGDAGYPLFTGLAGTNTTVADQMPVGASVTIASNTTVTAANGGTVITTSAAHGLLVGDIVTATATGGTAWVTGTYRIKTIPSTTSFTMADLVTGNGIAGTATDTGTVVAVASQAYGLGADLAALALADNPVYDTLSAAVSGTLYRAYIFTYDYSVPGAGGVASIQSGNTHILYVKESLASALLPDTNFTNFDIAMREHMNAFVLAATTADPQALGVANVR